MINFPRSINDTLSKCCKNLRQHAPIGQTMKMISTVHLRWGHRLKIFLTGWGASRYSVPMKLHTTSHVMWNYALFYCMFAGLKSVWTLPPPPAKRNDNDSLPFQSTQRLRQAFPQRWLSFEWGTVIRPPTNLMQTIKKQCERTLWSVT